MRKKGRARGPSKEDIERQAAEEVARLTRAAGPSSMSGFGPMGGPGPGGPSPFGGPPSPLDALAASVEGRTRPASPSAAAPRARPPSPYDQPATFVPGPFSGAEHSPGGGGREEDYDDDVDITELALVDHASRFGTNPEDLIVRSDPVTAEEMRDRAMQQFFERQAAMKKSSPGGRAPVAPLRGRAGGAGGPGSTPGKLSPLQAAIERKRRQQAGEAEEADDGDQTPTEQISTVGFEPAPARVFPDRDEPDADPLSELEELANLRGGRKAAPPRRGPTGPATKKAPARTTVKKMVKARTKAGKPDVAAAPKTPSPTKKAGKAAGKLPKAAAATKPVKAAAKPGAKPTRAAVKPAAKPAMVPKAAKATKPAARPVKAPKAAKATKVARGKVPGKTAATRGKR